jgi:putative nucleotidyltransferase with HDIG domain
MTMSMSDKLPDSRGVWKPPPNARQQLQALLGAVHHLGHVENEDELLHRILNDAVNMLDAQRGAIFLAEDPNGSLKLRATATGNSQTGARTDFDQGLAQRSFTRGESLLYSSVADDPELARDQGVVEGSKSSVICAALRTLRKRLGVLRLDRGPMQRPFTREDLQLADVLAGSVSPGIESAQLLRKQREVAGNTITMLAQAMEIRDPATHYHMERVARYSMIVAETLELAPEEMKRLRVGASLHDIGKICIDDSILRKPGALDAREFEIAKTHTNRGAEILEHVPDLHEALAIVRSHHERWDGHGYPDGLAGEDIPLLARIVAVADAFDALTFDRPQRKAIPVEDAFAELETQQGKQFDPRVVMAFLQVREKVVEEMCRPARCGEEEP